MEIKNVSKYYGKFRALSSINMKLDKGIYGLLGENGAGKTTLMRIITTVLDMDEGSITHEGISWNDKNSARSLIGYLPQKFSLYRQLTIYEALSHIAILKGIDKNRDYAIRQVIEMVNLDEQKNKRIGSLSGGMVRRLGIAQAILGNPQIIIVDEPTAGLDPEERIRFRMLIQNLGRNRIVLISTHIVEDVEAICDEVTIMHHGRLVTTGSCQSICNMAQGVVWKLLISQEEYERISNAYLITNQRKQMDQFEIRAISKTRPHQDAVAVVPTLEEAYMFLIGERDNNEGQN